MKKKHAFSILLFLSFITINSLFAELPPLIPRTVLFGNPSKIKPRISPDGSYLAYVAPAQGVLNIWLKDLQDPYKKDEQVTFDTHRGITNYMWAPCLNTILYTQDTNGDENWKLYGLNIITKQTHCYTPFENVSTHINDANYKFPTTILITMNKRNPRLFDLYKLHLDTGNLELIAENPGSLVGYLADNNLELKAGYASTQKGEGDLLLYKNNEWIPFIHWDVDDASLSGPITFDISGNYLYILDARNHDTARLIEYNFTTEQSQCIAHDEKYCISNVLFHPKTGRAIAVCFGKEKNEWHILDKSIEEYAQALCALDEGQIHVLNSDGYSRFFIIAFEKDTAPVRYYIFDRELRQGTFLFENKPELNDYQLAPMHPITYQARDGLTIHGYLTLPIGLPANNLPLVLNVHGGPQSRDCWGYDNEAQWLANRGYAVLQINFRGSSGYGKTFEAAGNREWAGKMHDDLLDGIAWARQQGIINPEKIAIYGGSYGGYAALVGATFTPDIFCCAIDMVGPCNLLTLAQSIPPYWEVFKGSLYKKIGNPETEPEFLMSRSPLFKVDAIKIPLLIAHGAHDPRVKQAEAEQIVAALQEKGLPHHYLLFEDEGHGLARPENRFIFYQAVEKFLAEHLQGRFEK